MAGSVCCVVGLGRVGLPTAVTLARAGHGVIGVDRDPAVLRAVAEGEGGATEPGLADALREQLASGRLRVTETPGPAAVTLICVGTPIDADRHAVLDDLYAAVDAVSVGVPPDGLVVIGSTVPVGTTDTIAARLRIGRPGVRVACCPERVLPGDALRELRENPRVVGGVDDESTRVAADWLSTWACGPIDRVDARTAELAKLVENAARDVELALAHTVRAIAERHGVDPERLRAIVNRHPRVRLLEPGIGVGGHCLPVDPWFLVEAAPAETALLRLAREVNDAVPAQWVAKIARMASDRPGARIGLVGLTYKPDTDDARNAPALEIARALSVDHDVLAWDPFVEHADGVRLGTEDEVRGREIVVVLVGHRGERRS